MVQIFTITLLPTSAQSAGLTPYSSRDRTRRWSPASRDGWRTDPAVKLLDSTEKQRLRFRVRLLLLTTDRPPEFADQNSQFSAYGAIAWTGRAFAQSRCRLAQALTAQLW